MTHQVIQKDRYRLLFWLAVFCLSIAGFAANAYISWRFFEARAYRSYDTIFDADPNFHYAYLVGLRGTSIRHPLELLILHPLALVASQLNSNLHLNATKWLVILLGPLAGVLKTWLLAWALLRLKQNYRWVLLLVALDVFSFSRLTVGSLPESFPLSAAAITALFLLGAIQATSASFRRLTWIALGTCIAGITVTNLAAFDCVLGWSLIQSGMTTKDSLRNVVVTTCQIAIAVGALYGASILLFHARPMSYLLPDLSYRAQQAEGAVPPAISDRLSTGLVQPPSPSSTGANPKSSTVRFFHFQPVYELRNLPLVDTYAFAGPTPKVVPIERINPTAYPTAWERSAPPFGFVMDESWSIAWALPLSIFTAALITGTFGWFRLGWQNQFAIAALMVLAFNAALHSIWGADELYLYVSHWQPALLILLSGGAFVKRRYPAVLLCGLLLTEIFLNTQNLQFMLTRLSK